MISDSQFLKRSTGVVPFPNQWPSGTTSQPNPRTLPADRFLVEWFKVGSDMQRLHDVDPA